MKTLLHTWLSINNSVFASAPFLHSLVLCVTENEIIMQIGVNQGVPGFFAATKILIVEPS